MNVTPIGIHITENRIRQNNSQPNFRAFSISKRPEMQVANNLFKENFPLPYNNLVSSCEKILKDTKYFDGLLDIVDNLLVLKLIHKKNFVWPAKKGCIAHKNQTNSTPLIFNRGNEIEFVMSDDKLLTLNKSNEDETEITYRLANWVSRIGYMWSEKASIEQAQLIKELDDTIGDMASKGSVYLGSDKGEVEYFPLKNS